MHAAKNHPAHLELVDIHLQNHDSTTPTNRVRRGKTHSCTVTTAPTNTEGGARTAINTPTNRGRGGTHTLTHTQTKTYVCHPRTH